MAQFTTEVDQLAKELSWLRQEFDGIKGVVNGWGGGDNINPYFNYIRTRDADFDYFGFLGGLGFNRGTSQNLPDATYTAVQWTGLRSRLFRHISWSSVAGQSSKISLAKPRQNDLYMFFGSVEFSSGSTVGVRELTFTEDSGLGYVVARMSQGDPSTTFVIPFSVGVQAFSTISFFTLNVWQDSGTTGSIINADMWALRFK